MCLRRRVVAFVEAGVAFAVGVEVLSLLVEEWRQGNGFNRARRDLVVLVDEDVEEEEEVEVRLLDGRDSVYEGGAVEAEKGLRAFSPRELALKAGRVAE